MQALNAVALALWLAQVLAHVYVRTFIGRNNYLFPLGQNLFLNLQHAVVSGLCVVCFLGAAGTLPYQQQRRSVGLDDRRKAEVAFGTIFGAVFGFVSMLTWSIK